MSLDEPNERVGANREATESRVETFYPGPSRIHLAAFPPKERWDDWTELDSQAWPPRKERRDSLRRRTRFKPEPAIRCLSCVEQHAHSLQKFRLKHRYPGRRGPNSATGLSTPTQH